MSRLEKVISGLSDMEHNASGDNMLQRTDTRAKIVVTVCFLVCMLSLPVLNLPNLILFLSYPLIACAMAQTEYIIVFTRSLAVLPFVIFIGIFNPLLATSPMLTVFGITVSAGWVTFFALILRALISTQAVLILIMSSGFHNTCRALECLGVPSILSTQLLFVYRYIFVLLQEFLNMHRARMARSFGRDSYPIKMWGVFTGRLFLRTADHSKNIHRAMVSRGFTGQIAVNTQFSWKRSDSVFTALWCTAFLILRFVNITAVL